jgi:hypothetical protein
MIFCLWYIRSALQQLVKKEGDLVAKFECANFFYNKNLEKLKLLVEKVRIYREILEWTEWDLNPRPPTFPL